MHSQLSGAERAERFGSSLPAHLEHAIVAVFVVVIPLRCHLLREPRSNESATLNITLPMCRKVNTTRRLATLAFRHHSFRLTRVHSILKGTSLHRDGGRRRTQGSKGKPRASFELQATAHMPNSGSIRMS